MENRKPLRLLALDGGGVRGLSSLLILKAIMDGIGPKTKPCEVFDLIGGTSTGGLIAIMLGRLEMSVDACIDAYQSLAQDVFKKSRSPLKFGIAKGLSTQGRYNHEELEKAIKSIIRGQGLDSDAPLKSPEGSDCKVFVCSRAKETSNIEIIRSYDALPQSASKLTIWEAGRATSAAPSHLDGMKTGPYHVTSLDGGLGANNPILHLWREAQCIWAANGRLDLESQLQCIVSIGTGTKYFKAFRDDPLSAAKSVSRIVTETEETARAFLSLKANLRYGNRYFRFTVPGLGSISLGNYAQIPAIADNTRNYVEESSDDLTRCSESLQSNGNAFGDDRSTATLSSQGQAVDPDVSNEQREELFRLCKNHLLSSRMCARFDEVEVYQESKWLYENDAYLRWVRPARTDDDPADMLLTLSGKSGIGKSVLMKDMVLADIARPQEVGPSITVSHFFDPVSNAPTDPEGDSNTPLSLYRSILGQVLSQVPRTPWHDVVNLGTELKRSRDPKLWSTEELRSLIKHVVLDNKEYEGQVSRFRVFIDAINECTGEPVEALNILTFASDLLKELLPRGVDIGICVSRQQIPKFGRNDPSSSVIHVARHIGPTISAFARVELGKLGDSDVESVLYGQLSQRFPDGFLSVTLALQAALRSSSKGLNELSDLIDNAPATIDGLHGRMLGQIDASEMKWSSSFLQLSLAMFEPLTVEQLRQACAFPERFIQSSLHHWEVSGKGLSKNDFEERLSVETYGLLESFAMVSDNNPTCEQATCTRLPRVRFIYHTTPQFLLSERGLETLDATLRGQSASRCHLYLFKCCIWALDWYWLHKDLEIDFLHYAAQFWPRHAHAAGKLLSDVQDLPDFLLNCGAGKNKRVVEHYKSKCEESGAIEYNFLSRGSTTMAILLATTGCMGLLRRHLRSCSTCQAMCARRDPDASRDLMVAMSNALMMGHTNTVEFLIAFSQRQNLLSPESSAIPEHITTMGGILNVMSHWIKGPRHTRQRVDPKGKTLLYEACYFTDTENNNDGILDFLLTRGADPTISSPAGGYEYPLHAAIALGRVDHVEKLLSHAGRSRSGVYKLLTLRPSQRLAKGDTALHFAARVKRNVTQKVQVLGALTKVAPLGKGLLMEKDGNGRDVLDVAQAAVTKGVYGAEKILEVLNDFKRREKEAAMVSEQRARVIRMRVVVTMALLAVLLGYFLC